ncbi:uncharacterized protein TRUGW13939_03637 [Talaromyces rugulosus]|uniref:Mitochondrial F1F0 ATP synthase subunit Atp18 n=1 Tax=Talaromyces rugulosus TaxID=121627 RepID=A0A7H8QRK5_TALRU|nr:uncharacterized protein TRUGW13939_03637 [Talaromyces rugulosus]QKX56532.1 hypothetical protein TRUGW13939_03637 [Talaromyces rugulosus]
MEATARRELPKQPRSTCSASSRPLVTTYPPRPLANFPYRLANCRLLEIMSLLGKKWPAPVGKTMFPFYAAGLVILYGVNSIANASMNSAEFKNDPRNPNAKPSKDQH